MTRRSLILIITLTLLALIGLTGIQVYWIRSAIEVKESTFSRAVNEAMTSVVYKLEKIETANMIRKKIMNRPSRINLSSSLDSINDLYFKRLQSLSDYKGRLSNLKNYTRENIKVEISQAESGKMVRKFDTNIVILQGRDTTPIVHGTEADNENLVMPEQPMLDASIQNIDNQISRLLKGSELVNEVFHDLLNTRQFQPIEKRINNVMLDSLISVELRNRGIETVYEFGVYSPLRDLMIFQKTGKFTRELLEKGHAFKLFPNDMSRYPDILYMYFPKEKKMLLTQMGRMLVVSVLLLLLVVVTFAFSVGTIIRQKKIAETRTAFINNMTHEFKTPISTVSLACEAITDEDMRKSEGLVESYIGIIREENRRLGNMAEKILQTAVIGKGQLHLKKEMADLHEILSEVIKNMKIQVEIRDGFIESDFRATHSLLFLDRVHLTNVFHNLLDNANKYSHKRPEIKVITEDAADGVIVSVKDNGIGISKVHQKKIFESLYRVPTGDIHDVKGFGLGLTYVKAIVEAHGGAVTVDSELNRGSTFRVYLPVEGG